LASPRFGLSAPSRLYLSESAVGGAIGVSGFEFGQTWMFGVVVFAWSAMLLALRIPELASLPADQTD
jgi:hypothetical protein